MPYSLEEQLKLFDPSRFEELCGQLVKKDFPESWHVEGIGGDEGIDIFAGELDKVKRAQTGSRLRVWQVKFFRDGVKRRQQKQAEKSLERVVSTHQPDFWTLCVPANLHMHGQRWFDSLKVQYPNITLDTWQADEIIHRVLQNELLLDSYFLHRQHRISKEEMKTILGQLEDFESVPDLLDRAHASLKDAADFYNGAIPAWSDIVQGFDAPREQFGKLWHFVADHLNHPSGRIPFAMITGRAGDGKSTVIMRLAAQLVDQGCKLVFYCKDDAELLRAEQFCRKLTKHVSIVIIDKITRFDAQTLHGFFERLYRESIPIMVIGAARLSLWEGLNLTPTLANVADICNVNLEKMTDNDIEALLDRWSADPDRAAEYLGALADLPREQQVARFREKAKRQLLVALLEVKHGGVFEAYVDRELRALENRFGPQIRRACTYISVLHRLDIPMPRNLLQRLLPNTNLDDDVLRHTRGLLSELQLQPGGIVTRHALVAEVIFNRRQPRSQDAQSLYEEIVISAEPEHQHRIGWALRVLTLRGEIALVVELLKIASDRFPSNVVFLHMHAVLSQRQGDISRARELFQKAGDVDPKSVHVWQAWAVMEKEQGDISRARELFQRGVVADPKHAHVWQAWAVMEKEQGDISRARELFQKATEVGPKEAAVWQAWAGLEARCGNIGDLNKEFTARWLIQKAAEADPNDPLCWTQWADLEKKQGNWIQAEELYLRAARVEVNLESRARIYFDLSTMFANLDKRKKEEKYLLLSIECNPNDHIAHARLGRTCSFQCKWDKSEKHFQLSLNIKPDDPKTLKWYMNMQRARAKYMKQEKMPDKRRNHSKRGQV